MNISRSQKLLYIAHFPYRIGCADQFVAQVAKDAAGKFNPNVKLVAHHANIKDPEFNIDWFQSFDLVFNALDNLDARRHVNKMCLAADVPLIESGTTGFNGQVQIIRKVSTVVIELLGRKFTISRGGRNATIAIRRRFPRAFLSARYEVHQVNRSTASCGQRVISSRMVLSFEAGSRMLILHSEIFGTSEDDAPELDHSADSENGKNAEAIWLVSSAN